MYKSNQDISIVHLGLYSTFPRINPKLGLYWKYDKNLTFIVMWIFHPILLSSTLCCVWHNVYLNKGARRQTAFQTARLVSDWILLNRLKVTFLSFIKSSYVTGANTEVLQNRINKKNCILKNWWIHQRQM